VASNAWMVGRSVAFLPIWTLAEADQIGPITPGSNPPSRLVIKAFPTGAEVYRYTGPVP